METIRSSPLQLAPVPARVQPSDADRMQPALPHPVQTPGRALGGEVRPFPLVAICVATFKRPQFLRDLLDSMISIELRGIEARLIIVDNDPAGSAGPIVKAAGEALPIPVTYCIEPLAGIPFARNRLVTEAARAGADFVAFVDDDQLVEPTWLVELVDVALRLNADAVGGRSIPRFEPGVPEWVRRSGLYYGFGQPTGTPATHLPTCNVLVRLAAMQTIPGPFEVRQEITGGTGTDYLFFDRFTQAGYSSVWCFESVAYERYLPSRTTIRWMLTRRYRYGVDEGVRRRLNNPSTRESVVFTARSVALVAKYVLFLAPAMLIRGRVGLVANVGVVCGAIGRVSGLFGKPYREYRHIHGH